MINVFNGYTYKNRNSNYKTNANDAHKRYQKVAKVIFIAGYNDISSIYIRIILFHVHAARVAYENRGYFDGVLATRAHCDQVI